MAGEPRPISATRIDFSHDGWICAACIPPPQESPAEGIAPAPSLDQEIDECANLRRPQARRLMERMERGRRRFMLTQQTTQAPIGKLPFDLP